MSASCKIGRFLLRVGGLFALSGLLMGPLPAPAAPVGDVRWRADSDSLSAAAVAFELRYGTEPAPTAAVRRDRWFGRDKAVHVAVSALWTLSTQYVLVNKTGWSEGTALPASVGSGAVLGVAKELYDASHSTRDASARDLAADVVGIGLAVGVIAL